MFAKLVNNKKESSVQNEVQSELNEKEQLLHLTPKQEQKHPIAKELEKIEERLNELQQLLAHRYQKEETKNLLKKRTHKEKQQDDLSFITIKKPVLSEYEDTQGAVYTRYSSLEAFEFLLKD